MNDAIRLTENETQAVDLILKDDFSDPIRLVEEIGYNKATFFQYGVFEYLDLRNSDLTGVSFQGARIGHVVLRPDQVGAFKSTGPVLENALDVQQATSKIGPETSLAEISDITDTGNSLDADDLIVLIQRYNPNTNEALIRAAYDYAQKMHQGQFRHSGEPYFTHPVSVAAILTEMRLDDSTIITALLHDTMEDTRATYDEIAELFEGEIADLVDGVTKLTNLHLSSTRPKQAENFRKLLMAISKDLRVLLVKLVDRLHNMRTIKSMRAEKQEQKARETMDIYAPLAGHIGLQWMREELEDLAFRVLNHEGRSSIIRRFITLQRETGDVIQHVTSEIRTEMEKQAVKAEVFGRAKKPYSLWRKMQEKGLPFKDITDIYGFRIIARTEDACYRALETIHQRWNPLPDYFEDYIAQPKSNGYRSIHTTVTNESGLRFEVQIRTQQMHEIAESGATENWTYRNGARTQNPFAVDPARWLSTLAEQFNDTETRDEFFEHVKLEMYTDLVFCFTPNGDVVRLLRGSTPIDFAYAIHTHIGHRCVGTKVDGIRVPLWTRLKNGQSVEIITAEGQTPQATWLDIAQTGKAKSAIRRALHETTSTGTQSTT